MDKINEDFLGALKKSSTIRILCDIHTKELNPENYVAAVSSILQPFTSFWDETAKKRILAIEVWPQHTYAVIDINNHEYDYDNAHMVIASIPVYLLQHRRDNRGWRFNRFERQDQPLARRIADLHRSNGQNPLPFLEDHVKGVEHHSPRTTWYSATV